MVLDNLKEDVIILGGIALGVVLVAWYAKKQITEGATEVFNYVGSGLTSIGDGIKQTASVALGVAKEILPDAPEGYHENLVELEQVKQNEENFLFRSWLDPM